MGEVTSSKHETRAEYDVTSPILGKALAPIHCHVCAESLTAITAQSAAIFLGNVYGFLINWKPPM
jgi:hypothetical protein